MENGNCKSVNRSRKVKLFDDGFSLDWQMNTGLPAKRTFLFEKTCTLLSNEMIFGFDLVTTKRCWQTNEYGPILFVIPLQDGLAVFGHDGTSAVLDSLTGEVRWRKETGAAATMPLFCFEKLFVATSNILLCLDIADGHIIWAFETPDNIVAGPSCRDGKIVIADSGGHVFCLAPPQ